VILKRKVPVATAANFSFLRKKKTLIKRKKQCLSFFGEAFFLKERFFD